MYCSCVAIGMATVECSVYLSGELNALKAEEDLEMLVWKPDSSLSKKEIDQFLVVARSVGTFARALDSTSTVRQPSLHMSAAAASRDITLVNIPACGESTFLLP